MSKKDFLSEIQRLKQARINLVAAKMEQILLQELALACVNKIQLKGTLNKEFSTNIKQWLPAKITDKVEGIPLREWEQSARVRTTVGGGARRRNRDEDDYDYDYDRSPKPAGLLGVLLGTGGTATTAYFLYNYLSKTENQEKIKEGLGFAREKLGETMGVNELQANNNKLKQLLNEANNKLAEFAKLYKQKPTTSESSSSKSSTDSSEVPDPTPISDKTTFDEIVINQNNYLYALNLIITRIKASLEVQKQANESKKGIDFENFQKLYNTQGSLAEASIYVPTGPSGNKVELQHNDGSPIKFLQMFDQINKMNNNEVPVSKIHELCNEQLNMLKQQFQSHLLLQKTEPSYVILLNQLVDVWVKHRSFFKNGFVIENIYKDFAMKSTAWMVEKTNDQDQGVRVKFTDQLHKTQGILETIYGAPEDFEFYKHMYEQDTYVTIMLANFILYVIDTYNPQWSNQLIAMVIQHNPMAQQQ